MAKSTYENDSKAVTDFITKLDADFAKLVQSIRNALLEIDQNVDEHIKWNSPSFFYKGEMKPFDPKDYKRDLVVINSRKNEALLVFPTGNIIDDKSGILEGNFPDGRKIVKFRSEEEFNSKKENLKSAVKDWLNKVEK